MLKEVKDLASSVIRKFTAVFDVENWQVQSEEGWVDIKTINQTVEYQVYEVKTSSGKTLKCADNHILITSDGTQIFAKNSKGQIIKTIDGNEEIVDVIQTEEWTKMYDFSLADESKHLYYADGILSHNTTLMTIYALWLATFFEDQKIIICGNKIATAMEIFDRIRLAYEDLPNWLKEPIVEFNKRSMVLQNGSKIETGPTTETAVRGKTVSCLILDEFAFVDNNVANAFWSAVIPTMVTNKNARLFVSSTANGVGNLYYDLWHQATTGKSDYKTLTVKWDAVPGRDKKWKEDYIANELHGDRALFEQEFECKFMGSTNSPFPPAAFEFIEGCITEPQAILQNGNLKIWEWPKENRVYCMGVDIGEGVGKDASVVNIFDFTDLMHIEQVATYYTQNMNTTDFAEQVYDLAEMYGFPVLALERNGCGTDTCMRLFYDKSYPRFVNYGSANNNGAFKPGIVSSQNTKGPAITNMKYLLIDNARVFLHDHRFLDELRDFERKDNGTWGAKSGSNYHDDTVMCMVWSLFPLHRNLVDTYFIVQAKDAKGSPLKIANKFKYHLTDRSQMANKFADYRSVPTCLFGRNSVRPDGQETTLGLQDRGWQQLETFWQQNSGSNRSYWSATRLF